jgi:hypothetical protein
MSMNTSRLVRLLQVRLELLDLRALAADHDARTRGADQKAQLVARPLDLDRTDAGGFQLFASTLRRSFTSSTRSLS